MCVTQALTEKNLCTRKISRCLRKESATTKIWYNVTWTYRKTSFYLSFWKRKQAWKTDVKCFKTNALCKEKICSLDLCKSSYLVIMPPALKNRFFITSFTEIRQKKKYREFKLLKVTQLRRNGFPFRFLLCKIKNIQISEEVTLKTRKRIMTNLVRVGQVGYTRVCIIYTFSQA